MFPAGLYQQRLDKPAFSSSEQSFIFEHLDHQSASIQYPTCWVTHRMFMFLSSQRWSSTENICLFYYYYYLNSLVLAKGAINLNRRGCIQYVGQSVLITGLSLIECWWRLGEINHIPCCQNQSYVLWPRRSVPGSPGYRLSQHGVALS